MLFLFLLTTTVWISWLIIKRHYTKWQRLGLETDDRVIIPFGSLYQVFRKEKHLGLVIADVYQRSHAPAVGMYMFFKPAILVRDATLARQIMTADFASFHDRGVYVDEKYDPLSSHLFNLKGQTWRSLRQKLTPSFSSGKLKAMFETIDEVVNKLNEYLLAKLDDGDIQTVEVKYLSTTYAIDIIGSVVYGLDIDSFKNPHNEFRVMSDGLFKNPNANVLHRIRHVMNFICPSVAGILCRLGVTDPITYAVRDIVQRTIEFREQHEVMRKDLLQLLIQLKNTGRISDDNDAEVWSVESPAENLKSLTIDMIAANLLLFYIAGSETTSATIAFTLYELAMYPKIYEKAQREIDRCLEEHGLKARGKLSYEVVQDMKYLDLCIMETMRKYPGLPFLNRECTQDYRLPDSDFTITKGTAILISLYGIHRDEEYFPNPLDYKPERFDPNSEDCNPVAYMPFGEGPRHCIAQRMGILNVKVALAKILANFHIEPMPRKEVEFKFHTTPVLIPKDALRIKLSKRF
ncbi:cytochrome P450 6d1 isoform X1 [Stomoxys calcitrans]|uniref:cytochrome P450 6d1 isoform X1 n=1 Tax=Stomoxys calcitrans TaxID=35570 RepID=UPI0027E25035|nr:cytochrome P450 6d1 isoform X1 [Stomoxys calcitrans]